LSTGDLYLYLVNNWIIVESGIKHHNPILALVNM
jgi:hypothetical protein